MRHFLVNSAASHHCHTVSPNIDSKEITLTLSHSVVILHAMRLAGNYARAMSKWDTIQEIILVSQQAGSDLAIKKTLAIKASLKLVKESL
jgi:hypothetical protein